MAFRCWSLARPLPPSTHSRLRADRPVGGADPGHPCSSDADLVWVPCGPGVSATEGPDRIPPHSQALACLAFGVSLGADGAESPSPLALRLEEADALAEVAGSRGDQWGGVECHPLRPAGEEVYAESRECRRDRALAPARARSPVAPSPPVWTPRPAAVAEGDDVILLDQAVWRRDTDRVAPRATGAVAGFSQRPGHQKEALEGVLATPLFHRLAGRTHRLLHLSGSRQLGTPVGIVRPGHLARWVRRGPRLWAWLGGRFRRRCRHRSRSRTGLGHAVPSPFPRLAFPGAGRETGTQVRQAGVQPVTASRDEGDPQEPHPPRRTLPGPSEPGPPRRVLRGEPRAGSQLRGPLFGAGLALSIWICAPRGLVRRAGGGPTRPRGEQGARRCFHLG